MKVIINNAEMVPTPKKGTIIRFGDLADEIMRKQPDYCFCGHIHSGNHELQEITGIHLANVSLVGEDYNIHYEPLYLNI